MKIFNPVKWGENDKYFGPFTFSRPQNRDFSYHAIVLSSGIKRASLRFTIYGYSFITALPNAIINTWDKKVYATSWSPETISQMGRNWYYESYRKDYGISISGGDFFQVFYGPQTHDSLTTKSWSKFLPWKQWRFKERRYYTFNGSLVDCPDTQSIPTVDFKIKDYDGEVVDVTTFITEMEWEYGEGIFKWLSWFNKPMIKRRLDIEFSSGIGPDKNSWKGGLQGTSIAMLPHELHKDAFIRFCKSQHYSKYSTFKIEFQK